MGKLAPQKTSLVFCGGGQTATSKAFDSAVKGVGPFLVVIRERSTRHVFGFYSHEDFGAKSAPQNTCILRGHVFFNPVPSTKDAYNLVIERVCMHGTGKLQEDNSNRSIYLSAE